MLFRQAGIHHTNYAGDRALFPIPADRWMIVGLLMLAWHRRLPRVDYAEMRREADEFFGTEDRIDDDPWERRRG